LTSVGGAAQFPADLPDVMNFNMTKVDGQWVVDIKPA
jgi:hypothetical protein